MPSVDVAWLLAQPGQSPALANQRICLQGSVIESVQPLATAPAGPRRLAMPALCNAHDHARTFRSATLGAFGQPLESWLPFLGVLPGADPYLCAATSFARSVRQGVARLMVHYTRVQGGMPYVEEALAVAKAARDVGVHIGFAVSMRDRRGIGLAEDAAMLAALRSELRAPVAQRLTAPAHSPATQLAIVEDLAQALQAAPDLASHTTPQYGPSGVQWCSTALLEAIAQASAQHQRPVHMHLLETRYQRDWCDQVHPGGVLPYLDQIGLLSPRLTLAHCTWARPEELALLAERGVTIAVNTSSNLGLKSGIAPLAEMLRQGCKVAMGLDGMALDEDDDALREMRLAFALHRGWGFEIEMTPAQLWQFAACTGRHSVTGSTFGESGGADNSDSNSNNNSNSNGNGNGNGNSGVAPGGSITPGASADLVVLDWDALDDDPLFDDIDPLSLLLARGRGSFIDEVIISGRCVVRAGQLVGLDEAALRAELLQQVRSRLAAAPEFLAWRQQLELVAEDLGPFYRGRAWLGCC